MSDCRYVTAVDEYEGGLMLTLDSTSRVLRTQSVLEFIKETVQTQGAKWKQAMTELLIGCSVMTTYNKKLFRYVSMLLYDNAFYCRRILEVLGPPQQGVLREEGIKILLYFGQ